MPRASSSRSAWRRMTASRIAGREDRVAALAGRLGLVHRDVGVAQQVGGRCAAVRPVATPTLRLTASSRSPTAIGSSKRRRMRSAISWRTLDVPRAGCGRGPRTRRRRAGRRGRRCRTARASRRATARSSWSPTAWPSVSLTVLKSSRSTNSTADAAGRVERRADALDEQRAVGEPGERVVVGLVVQALLEVAQLGHGLLEAVELQRGAGVGRERLEQREVVAVEAAVDPDAVGEHDRADDAVLAVQDRRHHVADVAAREQRFELAVERRAERDRAGGGADAQRFGGVGVDGLHRVALAVRAEARAHRRAAVVREQDDLGVVGAERVARAVEQALDRVGDLRRVRQRAVGLVEELGLLAALALGRVGAVADRARAASGTIMIGTAAGSRTTITAASSARLVLAGVTTASRPNIWRTSVQREAALGDASSRSRADTIDSDAAELHGDERAHPHQRSELGLGRPRSRAGPRSRRRWRARTARC